MGIETSHRGGIDDHATTLLLHDRSGQAGTQNYRLQINLDHEVPTLGLHQRIPRRTGADAGIVVEDIHPAELLNRGLEHPARVLLAGHVGAHENRVPTGAFDAFYRLCASGRVHVRDHYRCAVAREAFRYGTSDSRTAAGYDGSPSPDFHRPILRGARALTNLMYIVRARVPYQEPNE